MDVEVTTPTEFELDIAAPMVKLQGTQHAEWCSLFREIAPDDCESPEGGELQWQEKPSSFRPVPVQQCAPSSSSGQTFHLDGLKMPRNHANGLSRRSSRHCVR